MGEHSGRFVISRRKLLAGAGAVGLVGSGTYGVTVAMPVAAAVADEQYDSMRTTWQNLLTGGSFDPADPDFASALERLDADAETTIGLLDRTADRPGVFVDLPFIEEDTYEASSRVSETLIRLESLATVVRTPGSRYLDDTDLIADVLAGLETANQKVYYAGRAEFGNWYSWEISGPNALMNSCVLLYEHVPSEARERYIAAVDHFIPDPHYQYIDERRKLSTDSNRMWLCQAVALRGVVGRSEERIVLARHGLGEVFRYVTSGDGLYPDGSYLFHSGIPYTGSYGMSFVDRFTDQLVLYAGTPWEMAGAERDFALGTVDLALAPVVYSNALLDCVRGRSIARSGGDHSSGHQLLEILLRLAKGADAETAARWRAMGKGWLERDTYDDPFADASILRLALLKELLADSSVDPAPEPVNHRLFGSMDRAIHRRPGWAYAIAMSSARVSFYEVSGDRENVKGWHTGQGMTYLYDADNGQFTDGFWPTVDPNRLPGITVDSRPLAELSGVRSRPDAQWVGGAVLENEFAAVGMALNAMESSLRAEKSWFCLDQSVVALGADITGGGGHCAEAVADAHVNGGRYADTNYGSDNRLLVKHASPDGTREAYLAFDLTDLRSAMASGVVSASLHIYARVEDAAGDEIDIDAHGVPDDWAEDTLTWNTKPALGERLDSARVDADRAWRTFDVTAYVLDQLAAGKSKVGVALRQDPANGAGLSVWIASREYSSYAYDPFLYLTLAEPVNTVETVVENRNLHADGAGALVIDGKQQPTTQGWSGRFEGARWAHLEGVGGYVFPGGTTLNALREERTGSWRDINGGESPDPITRRYVTLWLDHGADPDAATYAYVLLPGVSAKRTAELAADPGVEIVANTGAVQAIRAPQLGVSAANFRASGTVRDLTVGQPCSIMIRERAETLSVAICDPTQRQESISVEIARRGYTTWSGDDTVTVDALGPTIRLRVDTRSARGKTHSVVFHR